jgi:Ca2+-transporting ATPase
VTTPPVDAAPAGSATRLPAYQSSVEEVISQYATSPTGMSSDAAVGVLAHTGPNALALERAVPFWRVYLNQFGDWMVLLLLASAVISAYLSDWHTAIVLVALVLFNTIIGFVQEYRAEKTMEALRQLVQPLAQVYRDGHLTQMASADLVVGDVVRLAEGDMVPADARLIELSGFATNDFAMTGESDPSRKFVHAIAGVVPMANRHNLAYMGTTVATGEAFGVVIATGMRTELGRIATLSQTTSRDVSPLQREIRHIATLVTYTVSGLAAVLLVIAMIRHLAFKDALLFAVGFASALIPQGLPAEVNTSLAQAASKLAKANALVKRLSAVEALGATQVICTDKTGTLTRNEMSVVGAVIGGVTYELIGGGYAPDGGVLRAGQPLGDDERDQVRAFFQVGSLASTARILPPDDHSPGWYCLGDPTEGALVVAATKAGVGADVPHQVRELPFDSARKRMTSLRADGGRAIAYVKGAPESVLERATKIRVGTTVRTLTDPDKAAFLAENTRRAELALRNLAFATRELSLDAAERGTLDDIEADLVLEGLVSMVDPLREAVPAAMAATADAHIAVNIVTGDFAPTALAIARQAGLAGAGHELMVLSGEDLEQTPDDRVRDLALRGGVVFSRVSPEDKMRIVGLARSAGAVVAVTGDGINDAPALKRADIGVAMGVTGTEVAKQAADVVLLDDSFATLVQAIREGRTIFANISKGVQSCFTSNAAELVTNIGSFAFTMLLGFPLALNVLQILAVDLLAELFPIAALGWDPEEGETMKRRPRDPKTHILNRQSIPDIAWCGLLIGGFALVNNLLFYSRLGVSPAAASATAIASATTMTYLTIVVCQLLNIMQRRSVHGLFTRYQLSNRWFWGSLGLSTGIMLAIAYVPVISEFFSSGPIGVLDWLYVLGAAAVFVLLREAQRVVKPRWAPGPWQVVPA